MFSECPYLKHSPATLEVTGSRPTFGSISEIYFLESIVSGMEGLEMVCVALRELIVPCKVSGDNW